MKSMRVLGSKVLVEGVEAAIEAGAGRSPLRHAMGVALSLPRVTVGKTRRDGDWDWTNRGLGKETQGRDARDKKDCRKVWVVARLLFPFS